MSSPAIFGASLLGYGDANQLFIRRDTTTQVAAGVTIYFADANANIRIKNGQIQIKDATNGLYHSLEALTDSGGVTLRLNQIGEN